MPRKRSWSLSDLKTDRSDYQMQLFCSQRARVFLTSPVSCCLGINAGMGGGGVHWLRQVLNYTVYFAAHRKGDKVCQSELQCFVLISRCLLRRFAFFSIRVVLKCQRKRKKTDKSTSEFCQKRSYPQPKFKHEQQCFVWTRLVFDAIPDIKLVNQEWQQFKPADASFWLRKFFCLPARVGIYYFKY